DPVYKVKILILIAQHFASQATRKAESTQTFLQAFSVADSIEDRGSRAGALRDLASALAQAGQWDRAEEVAFTIGWGYTNQSAWGGRERGSRGRGCSWHRGELSESLGPEGVGISTGAGRPVGSSQQHVDPS